MLSFAKRCNHEKFSLRYNLSVSSPFTLYQVRFATYDVAHICGSYLRPSFYETRNRTENHNQTEKMVRTLRVDLSKNYLGSAEHRL